MAEMAENTYVFSGSEEELDRLFTIIKNTPSIFKELDEQILDFYQDKGKVTVITESKWDNRPTQWKAFLKKNGLEKLEYGWQSIELHLITLSVMILLILYVKNVITTS